MKKNIWKYLTEKDSSVSHQIKGVQLILVIVVIILLMPVVWHHFGINEISENENQSRLDSLTVAYIEELESEKLALSKKAEKDKRYISNFKPRKYQYPKSKYKKQKVSFNWDKKEETFLEGEEKFNTKKSIRLINLNKAGIKDLKTIYGIGDVLAKRIVKFRERLGGYYAVSQLKEVYGIDSAMIPTINNFIDKKDSLMVSKIKVNQLEFKQLLRHPYLNYKEVQTIFNNRPITERNICRFLNNCERLKPYLDYSEI